MGSSCQFISFSFSTLFLLLSMAPSESVSLEHNKFYHLRNLAENSYLQVESGGILCDKLGSVITSPSLNTSSVTYRWKYIKLSEDLRWLFSDDNGKDKYHVNEVSMEPHEPNCYPVARKLNFIPVEGSVYRVQNNPNGNCLVSNGVENRISWTNCDETVLRQQWEFIDA